MWKRSRVSGRGVSPGRGVRAAARPAGQTPWGRGRAGGVATRARPRRGSAPASWAPSEDARANKRSTAERDASGAGGPAARDETGRTEGAGRDLNTYPPSPVYGGGGGAQLAFVGPGCLEADGTLTAGPGPSASLLNNDDATAATPLRPIRPRTTPEPRPPTGHTRARGAWKRHAHLTREGAETSPTSAPAQGPGLANTQGSIAPWRTHERR